MRGSTHSKSGHESLVADTRSREQRCRGGSAHPMDTAAARARAAAGLYDHATWHAGRCVRRESMPDNDSIHATEKREIHQPTYLPTCLPPTYLLPTYLPTWVYYSTGSWSTCQQSSPKPPSRSLRGHYCRGCTQASAALRACTSADEAHDLLDALENKPRGRWSQVTTHSFTDDCPATECIV
jgi:hypothetical protein